MGKFDQISSTESTAIQKELDEVTESLGETQDARLEERFLWIVTIFILLDAWWFSQMQSWGGPVALLVLQLILLVGIGRKCQVEDIEKLIDRLLDGWTGKENKKY